MFLTHHQWKVHVSGAFSWTIVFRFNPTNKCLLSLNWQVLKVLIVKFQFSTLDHCHHLLINLSCKALVNLSMPNIALAREVIAAAIRIALLPAFLKRGPRPPLGATRTFSGGHEQRPLLNNSAVILQNPIDEQGTASVDSLWKGATNQNHWFTVLHVSDVCLHQQHAQPKPSSAFALRH